MFSSVSAVLALAIALCAAFSLLPSPAARAATAAAPELSTLFAERTHSVVAVEFFVESETGRQPSTVVGLVADEQGLIVLLDTAVPGWLPPAQLKDFRVYVPGSGSRESAAAEYLGQDYLTGWHFLRAEEALRSVLVPCTRYPSAVPEIGDQVWGFGIMGKDFDFQPFLLSGRIALRQQLPQQIGFAMQDVASPGSPVFSFTGELVGWAGNPVQQERVLTLDNERYNVAIQNANGTGSFFVAADVLPHLGRVPAAPVGQDVPWLGVVGLQPVDREVTRFLKLENQSAAVVSDVVPGGPAALAGLAKRDIIVAFEGRPLPRFSPERVVTTYLEREILQRQSGDVVRLGIARGDERLELDVTLGRQPKPLKEAARRYFERLGLTAREFVLYDRIARRLNFTDENAVVANFVKPNSPASVAGLRTLDLITQIDSQPVTSYARAVELLAGIEGDLARTEFVLLISRGTDTQVIRVRLK